MDFLLWGLVWLEDEGHGKEQRRLIFAPGPGCLAGRFPLYLLNPEGLQGSQSIDVSSHPPNPGRGQRLLSHLEAWGY